MLIIKPPTHAVDGVAVYISVTDPAWDRDKLQAERAAWSRQARKAKHRPDGQTLGLSDDELPGLTQAETDAAIARAPVERYYAGKTRYQLGAAEVGADGAACTVRDFLTGPPAEFGLRRLDHREYQQVCELEHPRGRLVEACRLGLRAIKADGYCWTARGGETASEQLEALHAADPNLLREIGAAVLGLCRPLDPETEVPR